MNLEEIKRRLEECPYLDILQVDQIKLPLDYPEFPSPKENSLEYFAWFDRVSAQMVLFDVNPEYSQFLEEYQKEKRREYRQQHRRYQSNLKYQLRLAGASLYSSGSREPLLLLTAHPEMTCTSIQKLVVEYSQTPRVAPFWRSLIPSWKRFWYLNPGLVGRSVYGLEFYLALDTSNQVVAGKYDLVNLIQSQQEYLQLESQLEGQLTLDEPIFEGLEYQVLLRPLGPGKMVQSIQTVGEILYINLHTGPSIPVPLKIQLNIRRIIITG